MIAKIDELNAEAKGNYVLSNITEKTALATGKGEYSGTVDITFSITVIPEPETTITVSPKTATIKVGATTKITAKVENGVGTTTAVSGTPANATLVIAENVATITGVAVGTSIITFTNNEKTDTATITVEAADEVPKTLKNKIILKNTK